MPARKAVSATRRKRKGLERSRQRPRMGMIVREHIEQVAENLPEEKQHHEIGARHHADQDKIRQANHGEIPAGVPVLIHVSRRVAVDDDAHAGDQRHHHRAQPVDVESDGDGERGRPRTDRRTGARRVRRSSRDRASRRRLGRRRRWDRRPSSPAHAPSRSTGPMTTDAGGCEQQKRHQQDERHRPTSPPRRRLTINTALDRRQARHQDVRPCAVSSSGEWRPAGPAPGGANLRRRRAGSRRGHTAGCGYRRPRAAIGSDRP